MRRLSGEDAGFLALELPIQPMNSVALAVLRPARSADGTAQLVDPEYLFRHMAARLDQLPAFRWRVQRVPFGINHPVFFEDPDFDLGYHLREFTLPGPGRSDQLDRYVETLAGQPVDRLHPLWQLTLVDGLEHGRQAVVLRIHHCLMDGFATVNTLARIFSNEDDAATHSPWRPERTPRPWRLVIDALRDQGRAGRQLPALVGKTRRNLEAVKAQRSPGVVGVPRPGVDAPASSIDRGLSAGRRFARTSLPLADVKLVKTAAGMSVNDVALAVVAGAFRAYLEDRNDLPSKALLASVPVGMEAEGAPLRTSGNRFSALTTSLATDIADPWERLQVIGAVTAQAKREVELLGPEMLPDWLEYVPPAIAERLVRRSHRKRRRHPDNIEVNVVISNIRGPRAPWSLGSTSVEEIYIAGPPNNGVGANVVLCDYGDRLLFGILTFADSIEDPAELSEGLHHSLAALVRAAELRTTGKS